METIMMKAIFAFAILVGHCSQLSAANYYVDNQSGDDAHSGKVINKPIQSLDRVNRLKLGPGDKLLFKANSRYTGQLKPVGRGAKGAVITIGMYGEGAKPRFDGEGKVLDTVLIRNME